MKQALQGKVLIGGTANGTTLVLSEPLSLWGGLDPKTGIVIDQRHPNLGDVVTGKVLVLPAGRGSSSASSILLEAVRQGKAPAAIIMAETDGILTLGAAVARELYEFTLPVLTLNGVDYAQLESGQRVWIEENGRIHIDSIMDTGEGAVWK